MTIKTPNIPNPLIGDYKKILDNLINDPNDFRKGQLIGFEIALHTIGFDVLREISFIESKEKPDAFE